ncbi:MAG: 30S ribosomal protein S7 [Candidatus Krumholzibacteria bacterium]|jgi:small subunit ribosomal protein S7|nr:30S ribosomal protein S7 [Candidatus Krumholzibacteria bacterium]MDP6669485.1 30S ribosomal protein S7 [Candidatus Krumholzibacteria bacterium]MDP6797133.1 30S ribosomal protein S7 [Candidatus Krumholzibacteria bacterium]MDP7022584.1 30S ribosomal protein S7 [Candidatus Krumholzibacteria bacterium]
MARRGYRRRQTQEPDARLHSALATQFINNMMKGGKKSISESIFYGAMNIIEEKSGKKGLDVFTTAINNVKPNLEVMTKRIGGANYQVPIEVRPARRTALAIRWILIYSRSRNDKNMAERLANELLAAYRKEGSSMKKREESHRMAEANKAFAHFKF